MGGAGVGWAEAGTDAGESGGGGACGCGTVFIVRLPRATSALSAAVIGVSLLFGMRHEFGAGVAVEGPWDDPVLIFRWAVFDEDDDSVHVSGPIIATYGK